MHHMVKPIFFMHSRCDSMYVLQFSSPCSSMLHMTKHKNTVPHRHVIQYRMAYSSTSQGRHHWYGHGRTNNPTDNVWPKLTRNMRISVDFVVQNVLKLTSTFISKNFFRGDTPGPTKWGRGGIEGRGWDGMAGKWREGRVEGKGREGEERRWEGNWEGKGAYGYDTEKWPVQSENCDDVPASASLHWLVIYIRIPACHVRWRINLLETRHWQHT